MRLLYIIFALLPFWANTQTYTFECVCDYVVPPNCDLCNTQVQSRLFNGLLIRKNGNAFKWIDAPYIVRRQGAFAAIQEIVFPNPESISIPFTATAYDSIQPLLDAIQCYCSGIDLVAGSGIVISGDTISAIDTSITNELQRLDTFAIVSGVLRASLLNDNVPFSSVVLPVANGSETIVNAGTGIGVSGNGTSGTPYVITNTLPNQVVSIIGGGINSVTGTYPNFTLTATEIDGSVTNELQTLNVSSNTATLSNSGGSVTIAGSGINTVSTSGSTITILGTEIDGSTSNELQNLSLSGQSLGISSGTGVTLPVVNVLAGTNINVSNAAGVYTINNTVSGLPTGVLNNTLRFDGTNWVTTPQIINNGTQVGIGGNPISGFELYVNGGIRADGTFITRGTGALSSDLASKVRFWNNGGTGDSYDLHSEDDGTFTLSSSGLGEIFTTIGNDLVVTDRLRITGSGTTATSVIGRNALNEVTPVTLGSGLTLTAGTLSATGGGSGTVTSVAATQPASGLTITGSPVTTSGTLVFALNNDLQGLENLATNGIAVRTATSTWANRTLTAGSGISITNGDGIAGNPTISATGSGGTVTSVAATAPASGFTVSGSPITGAGTLTFALNNDLLGLENMAGTGLVTRTAANSYAQRTLTAGAGISITNGDGISGNPTIAATGGGSGTVNQSTTLVDGRVTLSAGSNLITDDANMTFNRTTDQLTIGTGNISATLNVLPLATSGTVEVGKFSSPTTGNSITTFVNTSTGTATANSIVEISTGAATSGDPMVGFVVSGANRVSLGIDNSDADKFKITPGATTPGGTVNKGVIITQDAATLVGINKDAPITALDVIGSVKGSQYRGQSTDMVAGLLNFGVGAGTGPVLTLLSGYSNGFSVSFTAGTAPTTNGIIFALSYPIAFASASYPVFSARNASSATEITKFFVSSSSGSAFNFTANGTLTPGATYSFYFTVNGI